MPQVERVADPPHGPEWWHGQEQPRAEAALARGDEDDGRERRPDRDDPGVRQLGGDQERGAGEPRGREPAEGHDRQ